MHKLHTYTLPIEYRVWDISERKWLKQTGNPYIFPFDGRVAMKCCGDRTGIISKEDYKDYYILEQYTGLKDVDGVKIYEGDIYAVRESIISSDDPDPGIKYIVRDEKTGQLTNAYSDGNASTSGLTFCRENAKKCFKVIGNIHEHIYTVISEETNHA